MIFIYIICFIWAIFWWETGYRYASLAKASSDPLHLPGGKDSDSPVVKFVAGYAKFFAIGGLPIFLSGAIK